MTVPATDALTHPHGLQVIALWRVDIDVALARARRAQASSTAPRVVFAQQVKGTRPSSQVLREWHAQGISVVPVSSRLQSAADDSNELRQAVWNRLQDEARLRELHRNTRAPTVDTRAAETIARAHGHLPPVSSSGRRSFLEDFYADLTGNCEST